MLPVSPFRRVLVILGLLLLLASLCLLVVANLPTERLQDRQPLPAEDLTLPTPEAFGGAGQLASAACPGCPEALAR
jgi:hypothetical protein